MTGTDRQRLAVLLGPEGSLPPAEIIRSGSELADICFLLDSGGSVEPGLRAVAEALADTEVVDFGDPGACLDVLRGRQVSAVTTFVDVLCPAAARLDRLIKGDTAPGPPWGRKDVQRAMFVAAGVSAVSSAPVPDEESLRAFLAATGFPVVVKPADGVASRDAWLLRGERDVRELVGSGGLGGARQQGGMFAERFIAGLPPAPYLADYVSVEVFRPGALVSSFVTDRLPPVWPLREAGVVLPSVLDPAAQRMVTEAANDAIDALGAGRGAFHVEMKLTRPRPEVIEVNGRLGGFVPRLFRYATGGDLGRVALSCALGHAAGLTLNWERCALMLFFQPPALARRVTRVPSRRVITRRPGVLAVDDLAAENALVDWRDGTNRSVAKVWLAADSHGELHARLIDLAVFLTDEFGFSDEAGAGVREDSWLERISAPTLTGGPA